ncbi:hypothetical protein DVH24_008558 [Malus domestica]|uniref:Uncharacterized protein n=1 Tax=Malus domestica TaxID=3750 RepID=A0A498JK03_MALDO|nr:hypothetical protein DVH24_008558 [Malus domestica]
MSSASSHPSSSTPHPRNIVPEPITLSRRKAWKPTKNLYAEFLLNLSKKMGYATEHLYCCFNTIPTSSKLLHQLQVLVPPPVAPTFSSWLHI